MGDNDSSDTHPMRPGTASSDHRTTAGATERDVERAEPAPEADGADVALSDVDVLHVITGEKWGGAPRVVELLATRTASSDAVACAPNPRLVRRLETAGVPVHRQPHLRAPPSPFADVRALADLVSLLRRESFDLVHCHSTKSGTLGRVAAYVTGHPAVFSVHGWGFYNTEFGWLAPVLSGTERLLSRVTDGIVCVSENDLEEGLRRGITDEARSSVVHNGIPPVHVPDDRTRLADVGVDTERPVIGTVGRLAEQKRPTELFRVGRDLDRRDVAVSTVWIGQGSLEEQCRRFIDRNAVDGHLPGFRDDALELALDFDVFVVPSRFEGFPISILEAMSLGLPVVAYDVGGVGEAVVDGETGFVVTPGDREALTDRVERLVRSPGLASRMGRRGRERFLDAFSVDRMIAEYEGVYRSVMDGEPVPSRR